MAAMKNNCSFCGSLLNPGTGKMFVKRDGTTLNFCRRKCEMNMILLGRDPKKVKWTAAYQKLKSSKKKA